MMSVTVIDEFGTIEGGNNTQITYSEYNTMVRCFMKVVNIHNLKTE